jgi:dipeptidase E
VQRILAIGGGGFAMGEKNSPIDEYIIDLTGKTRPQVCFLATPSGDFSPQIANFHDVYGKLGCGTSHLAFFNQAGPKLIPAHDFKERILEQDVIFVGGGNPRSAIAVWREWSLDKVLYEAWQRGVLLAGMSAGAMCWFEHGIQVPAGDNNGLVDCLGLLRGGCAVHYHNSQAPARRTSLLNGNAISMISSAIAIDDYAAVLYHGMDIERVLSWRPDATAYRVQYVEGVVNEMPLSATSIQMSPLEPVREAVDIDPAILRRYIGKYELLVSDVMTITMENDSLYAQLPGQVKVPIFPQNECEFFLKVVDAQLTFDIDNNGQVISLTNHQNGRDVVRKKVQAA